MNEMEYQEIMEAGWRRKLTPEEDAKVRAWLAADPARLAEWETEAALNQRLGQLPDAPVATNFTARILQEVGRFERAAVRPSPVTGWLHRLFRRPASALAWAAMLIAAGWVGYQQFGRPSSGERAQDLAVLLKSVGPEPALFDDFEAIRKLPQADDEELYAVLSVQQ